MKIGAVKTIQVEAKTLCLHLKVCDAFYAQLKDEEGYVLKNYEGYVPNFMPGEHFGDYVILDVEIDTGKITNWEVPTQKQVEAFIEGPDQ